MPRPRTSTTELVRLLNVARQPVYVLDVEWAVVFCNKACLDWIGCTEDELIGRRCAYHSGAGTAPAESLLAGLSPPPEAMAGTPTTALVAAGGRSRRARFVPLGTGPQDCVGLVVVVDSMDLAEPESAPSPADEPGSPALHEQIRRFRQQMAARYRIDLLLGDSPAARRIRSQVHVAAGCRASVLLCGPPGSGRQHVAAAIHYAGDSRHAGSLVPVACPLLGAEMIEDTIRAISNRRESAANEPPGTLLLTEVDQLDAAGQETLRGVISGRSLAMRPMATSRRPLLELARRGEFREDLAAALSTIVIELPALARRREDLPLVAQFFLEEQNARGGKQLSGFSPEALDRLDAHDWPGNYDELARAVAEAYQRAAGPEVLAADLPPRLALAAEPPGHPRRKEETIVLDEFLGRVERELIDRALQRAKGNKAKAARLLGLTRARLYRRLVQLGMAAES